MSYRVWENLPDKFKLGEDPEQPVTLWRGDRIGKEVMGMHCHLEPEKDPEEEVYVSLFVKYPQLKTVVKRHCRDSFNTPFVSLARDIRVAQYFADPESVDGRPPDTTIYEVTIPTFRLVVIPLGAKHLPAEQSEELLAIGTVEPTEITAIKRNNTPLATELLDVNTGIAIEHSSFAINALRDTAIRPVNPNGEWDRSMSWVL